MSNGLLVTRTAAVIYFPSLEQKKKKKKTKTKKTDFLHVSFGNGWGAGGL